MDIFFWDCFIYVVFDVCFVLIKLVVKEVFIILNNLEDVFLDFEMYYSIEMK